MVDADDDLDRFLRVDPAGFRGDFLLILMLVAIFAIRMDNGTSSSESSEDEEEPESESLVPWAAAAPFIAFRWLPLLPAVCC